MVKRGLTQVFTQIRWQSTAKKCPYVTLGVRERASPSEIKEAFYNLSKQYHPDSPTANASTFIEVKEAYDILRDPAKRLAYDSNQAGGFRPFTDRDKEMIQERFYSNYRYRSRPYYRTVTSSEDQPTQTREQPSDIRIVMNNFNNFPWYTQWVFVLIMTTVTVTTFYYVCRMNELQEARRKKIEAGILPVFE